MNRLGVNGQRSLTRLAATVLAAGLVAVALTSAIWPPTEMTRLRNSLLADVGAAADFAWAPDTIPSAFLRESAPAPALFVDAAARARHEAGDPADTWGIALALGRHLRSGPGDGRGLKTNTVDAYTTMMNEEAGYCADFTQVYNALAHAAGIEVREWGMSFDGFGGDGHAFSEVWLPTHEKWAHIDTHRGFFAADPTSGTPLSALELRDRLLAGAGQDQIRITPISPDRPDWGAKPERAIEYYRRGADQMYLWFGTNVFSYDAHPLVAVLGRFSRALEQSAAILAGIHPTIRIIPSSTNRQLVDDLFTKRNLFFAGATLLALLALVAGIQLRSYFRRRGDSSPVGAGKPAAG